jgi:putative addiction module component (TIGR02574 family)
VIRVPVDAAAFGIEKMTIAERLDLIEQIWESLPEEPRPSEIPAWHLDELTQRHADIGLGVGKPWREVVERRSSTG